MAGSTLVFRGYDSTHGLELWRSGGTPETTTFLAALGLPLPASSSPEYIWPAGSRVVFLADDGVNGKDLWGSDGTDAGTVRLRPDEEPINFAVIFHAVSAEHLVYFVEFATGTQRGVLWRTDGTPAGTFPLTPPEVDVESGRSDQTVVAHGDTCFFIGEDEAHGTELWTTDGTVAGTHLVSDVEPGPSSSFPYALDPFLGRYLFNVSAPTLGTYVTDGTAAGTKRFDEAFPFLEDLVIVGAETGGKALLRKRPDALHSELWTTDGTAAGTRLLIGNFGYLEEFSASGGYFLFKGGATFEDSDIYLSDGTTGGTVRIASDLSVFGFFGLRAMAGGRFVFSATQVGEGNHAAVWTTDGTPAGTRPLIETESAFDQPEVASRFAGKVLLTGGNRVWVTDGTPAGTSVLIELEPDFVDAHSPSVAGDRAFFPFETPETGNELWAFRPD
jgi:ELWxxDGT repeat protein